MRRKVVTAVCLAALLAGVSLSACDDGELAEQPGSRVTQSTGETSENAARGAAQDAPEAGGSEATGWSGEQAGRLAAEAVEKGWRQTKDFARRTVEAWNAAPGDETDAAVARIWEETKDRARRGGEIMKEAATAADDALGSAWRQTKDAAKRTHDAWRRSLADDPADEAVDEVSL